MTPDWLLLFALFCAGAAIAAVSGGLGIGGGVFSVPALLYAGRIAGLPETHLAHMAVSGALAMAFLFSASASWRNYQSGLVRVREGLGIAVGAILGAVAGARLAGALDGVVLERIFATFLLLNGSVMLFRSFRRPARRLDEDEFGPPHPRVANSPAERLNGPLRFFLLLFFPGALIGLASAVTGIGGGVLLVPQFLFAFRFRTHVAAASSTFCIIFVSFSGAAAHVWEAWTIDPAIPDPRIGYLYLPLAAPLFLGGLLGGYLAPILSGRISPRGLRLALAVLQLAVGAQLGYEALA